MSPYLCFLVSVVHSGELLKCAMKIHCDCLTGDAPDYVYEPENKIQFYNLLPGHVKSCGEIVEIVQIFDVCEINPPSEEKMVKIEDCLYCPHVWLYLGVDPHCNNGFDRKPIPDEDGIPDWCKLEDAPQKLEVAKDSTSKQQTKARNCD